MSHIDIIPSAADLGLTWRKSRYSGGQSNCLEVSDDLPGLVPVRDSKNPSGPALVFPACAWTAFVAGMKAGDFGA